jgi:ABC-type polar amino acid transport system ATPase subunit
MKAHLMFRDGDFNPKFDPSTQDLALIQDLDLDVLFAAMTHGDKFLDDIVRTAVLTPIVDVEAIKFRQDVIKDCLQTPKVVRAIYDLAGETLDRERREFFGGLNRDPNLTLYRSVRVMEMMIGQLAVLRQIVDRTISHVVSDGMVTLFSMLQTELDDDYLAAMHEHLHRLKFAKGVLISARLGAGLKGSNYVLRRENPREGSWFSHLLEPGPPHYSYRLEDRDENGARALAEVEGEGLNLAANALAQAADHIKSFFKMLRIELGFFVGCINLHEMLELQNAPTCFPAPARLGQRSFAADELYDICLALNLSHAVVGNDIRADGKDMFVVTGANQGGKSTFLRSVAISQIMMQCGLFVAARSYHADVVQRVFTHYKREEDIAMNSGKFDEELARMSALIDVVQPNAMVLFNESFAATNEREGSEVARQIVMALLDYGVKMCFVTHQYTLARSLLSSGVPNLIFLRAERQSDGNRTFRIIEGEPQPTSHGMDLYTNIFGV